MKDLEGRLALVTGGGKGIGKVIAHKLAQRGAHVIVNFFHSLEQAKRTRDEIAATGAKVDLIRASVSRQDQVDRMFAEIRQRFGHLDILVNNAASGAMVPMEHVTEDYFDRALGTNLKGAFWCSRRAAPLMDKRGGGIIVNLSSIGAGLAVPNYVVVGTSKAGLESLTRYLAAEFAPRNIRVNAASAGMIDTDVVKNFPAHEEMRARIVESTPLGRIGKPEDLADVVMFLTSDASRWVIGQTIVADGGISLAAQAFKGHAPAPDAVSNAAAVVHAPAAPASVEPPAVPAPEAIPVAAPAVAAAPATEPAAAEPVATPAQSISTHAVAAAGSDDIAVVGIGLALPGAADPEQFWDILMRGPELFDTAPRSRWLSDEFHSPDPAAEDKNYSLFGGFVTDPPAAGPDLATDGSVVWLRHSLAQALANVRRREGERASFVVGYTPDGNQRLEECYVTRGITERLRRILAEAPGDAAANRDLTARIEARLHAQYPAALLAPNAFLPEAAGRRAMHSLLPESTEVLMVDTACSSSLYAIDIGAKALLMGKCDIAVCGGAFALAPLNGVLFSKLGGLSRQRAVRSLDRDGDGVLFSDGAGVVVLKRLQRALEDGDRILGVVNAFGSSSDGRGKAIYAPAAEGQCLALRRAQAHPAYQRAQVDWVLAHATGTPAGDRTEIESIAASFPGRRNLTVTSNKSVVGHTGWAAGVTSLIQCLLAFERNVIPPQHRFVSTPAAAHTGETGISIPRTAQPWPRIDDAPRHAAISSFGFGGTNAHLLVREHDAGSTPTPTVPRPYDERIVLVGWAAHVPGLDGSEAVARWVRDEQAHPPASFGAFYPSPPFEQVRMPPRTVRTVDRTQLMILACAHQLLGGPLGGLLEDFRKTTGAFIGHMGRTRHAIHYGHRVYLDELQRVLRDDPAIAGAAQFESAFEQLRAEVRKLVPAANEDSFPGLMPNVIAARLASFFNLNGLTLACDAGFASTLAAFELGARYLRSGELDLAFVGGINGNSGWEAQDTLRGAGLPAGVNPGEGAFLFALMRERTARERGLPILAFVDSQTAPHGELPTVACGTAAAHSTRPNYMGAESAWAVLRALHLDVPGALVRCTTGLEERWLRIERQPQPGGGKPAADDEDAAPPATIAPQAPQPQVEPVLAAMQACWEEMPAIPVTEEQPWLPRGAVLLTDLPHLLDAIPDLPPDLVVLSTAPLPAARAGWHHVQALDASVVATILGPLQTHRHLRMLTDLEASAPATHALATPATSLMALSDLMLLATQAMHARLSAAGSSIVPLLLGAWHGGVPHPFLGMFSGMMKSTAAELAGTKVFAVFTSARDVPTAVSEARQEWRARRFLPAVVYARGRRMTPFLREALTLTPGERSALDEHAVVLAVGGARGIAFEILQDIARRHHPHLFIVGSNDPDAYPADAFAGTDEEFARSRPQFLREAKARQPEATVGTLNAQFERTLHARATRRNLQQLEQLCGPGKVHYRACSVLDGERLVRVVGELLPAGKPVDLVLYAAGINRAGSIQSKSLESFRTVRDIKVAGYQNLRRALGDARVRTWINFGSLLGVTGLAGETDYAAGNDFLASAAEATDRTGNTRELTIAWTVWGEAGLVQTHPLNASRTLGARRFSNMTTQEGLVHFKRLLEAPAASGTIALLGPVERQSLEQSLPGWLDAPPAATAATRAASRFYIDRVLDRDGDRTVFERTFSLVRDGYLSQHLVNGHPTLPGTFVAELAAQAALELFPQLHVVALEDLRFEHFLRVYGETPAPKRIEARVEEQGAARTVVKVRVLTDVHAPDGRVLTRDKLHFSARVILMTQHTPAPHWDAWDSTGDTAVPDPYHHQRSPVLLSGVFVTTRDTRLHPLGKRALYAGSVSVDDPTFARFVTPCLMMDGMLRTAALMLVDEDYLPIAAPASIRRIDLYQDANDARLAATAPPGSIELYAVPLRPLTDRTDGENRCVAVDADGRVLLQMKGVDGAVVGFLHRHTGEFVAAQALRARKTARTGNAPETVAITTHADVAPVTRQRWRPIPIAPADPATQRLRDCNVLIVGGTAPMRNTIAARLRSLGALPVMHTTDWSAETAATITGVVDLGALDVPFDEPGWPWEPALERTVRVLHTLYERWLGESDPDRIFYVPVTAMGGRMGHDGAAIVSPYGGLWAGLAKSLPRELPNCNIKVVDVADAQPQTIADALAAELGVWDLFEVGHRDGQRHGLLGASEPQGAQRLALGPDDLVLVSGGGRGIGFRVAEALASKTGCRVIVTGRTPAAGDDVAIDLSDEAFRAYASERLKAGAASGNIAQAKAHIRALKQQRELSRNLQRVRARGLRVDYRVCDFSNADQVAALVASLGSALTGVIHNAGVDAPQRLIAKSTDNFLSTLRVKVAGFVNLWHALAGRKLAFFCNVGSIAGRVGGMAGETDYAAGNDALTRLGFWAAAQAQYPIKTVCWPTWNQIGGIANFEAAVKYMAAMDIEEGVSLWLHEILQGDGGEVCFLGRPGRAVSPMELKGYRLVTPDFPTFQTFYSRVHYLGKLLEYRHGRSLRARTALDARQVPLLHELRVQQRFSVPVSLLLEYAIEIASNDMVPQNWPALRLGELRNAWFDLTRLALPLDGQPFVFDRHVSGQWQSRQWVVDVSFIEPATGECHGQVQLVFDREEEYVPAMPLIVEVAPVAPECVDDAPGLTWSGRVLDSGQWNRGAQGELIGDVRPGMASDLWVSPHVPGVQLPAPLVEASLRAQAWSTRTGRVPDRVAFACLRLLGGASAMRVIRTADETFLFVDQQGTVTHRLDGLRLQALASPDRKSAVA